MAYPVQTVDCHTTPVTLSGDIRHTAHELTVP